MNEKHNAEEFSEIVDRMLAGEKVELDTLSEEQKSAVSFAHKLMEYRTHVSPSFQAQLKAKLLSKLSQEETKVKVTEVRRNWFWGTLSRLVPPQPVWRVVTVFLFVVLAGSAIWASGILTETPLSAPAPVPAPTPPPGGPHPTPAPFRPSLAVGGTPVKSTYLPGETVTVEFVLTNVSSDDPITLKNFPPGIVVSDASFEKVWSSPAGSAERGLKPGEVAKYSLNWDQRDASGTQVAPGFYYLGPEEVQFESKLMGKARIGSVGVARVLVVPAQGVMEKLLELDQSVTAAGITITLQRVESTASGFKILAFSTPPGYEIAKGGGPPLPPPAFMVDAVAQYQINGGPVRKAGSSGNRFLENGIELIWESLGPIPSDAKMLTFTITKLGEQTGPWEFKIPLE